MRRLGSEFSKGGSGEVKAGGWALSLPEPPLTLTTVSAAFHLKYLSKVVNWGHIQLQVFAERSQ